MAAGRTVPLTTLGLYAPLHRGDRCVRLSVTDFSHGMCVGSPPRCPTARSVERLVEGHRICDQFPIQHQNAIALLGKDAYVTLRNDV